MTFPEKTCLSTWRHWELSVANKTEDYNLIILGWRLVLKGVWKTDIEG